VKDAPIAHVAATLAALPAKTSRRRVKDYPDPQRQEDADYRAAYGINGKRPYGRGLRAAFYAELAPAPAGRFVGREDAKRYLAEIDRVIDLQCWPRHEKERLRVIRHRWLARAEGRDARFAAVGAQGGVNEKCRKRTAGDAIAEIRRAILESAGETVTRPGQRFVSDAKWPLGKPV
jgi:hypothetical protein